MKSILETNPLTQYTVDTNWCDVPDYIHIENCHEMAQSRDGRIFLSVDHPDNNILVFSAQGDFLQSWTLGYNGCHGLTLYESGEIEYLLITQTGVVEVDGIVQKGRGEVVQTSLNGDIIRKLPDPIELGLYDPPFTYNPTETCVAPNGDIYIADGYGASFIHCFDNAGDHKFSFGGTLNHPCDNSLFNPHGITLDYRPTKHGKAPQLVVSSRKQSKLKFFSLEGEFLRSIPLPGAYPCRAVVYEHLLFCGICWSGPTVSDDDLENYANRKDKSGFVLSVDELGIIQHTIGADPAIYIDGELQSLQTEYDSLFNHIHDVLPLNDQKILICQWRGERKLPYLLTIAQPSI
ncbi:hypothetical protein BCU70_09855 [Vibrio sp. 10N.286.49.C2]|uniref:hypothetical protein n=1 Tax=unclassified Vibrio TaxID=2614977 RepID=UPI000C8283C3|nr:MULTISPECIES: hypothetical protein [unclassified Vibrio]PMH26444.1 hypothetical protein BCU70_09855 [Vibrio sp. 10N.286.49.C2]PMH54832.1 hypothetical protein BCU66_11080 [Vibrio sp. 10N.286.49.B1]PMH82088.1 hypothetical protein BCU58_19315 [Vibrio sp. 10N.286.48.B7]